MQAADRENTAVSLLRSFQQKENITKVKRISLTGGSCWKEQGKIKSSSIYFSRIPSMLFQHFQTKK